MNNLHHSRSNQSLPLLNFSEGYQFPTPAQSSNSILKRNENPPLVQHGPNTANLVDFNQVSQLVETKVTQVVESIKTRFMNLKTLVENAAASQPTFLTQGKIWPTIN